MNAIFSEWLLSFLVVDLKTERQTTIRLIIYQQTRKVTVHLLNEKITQPYRRAGSVPADPSEVQSCFETDTKIQSSDAGDTEPCPFPLGISHHSGHVHDRTTHTSITMITQ